MSARGHGTAELRGLLDELRARIEARIARVSAELDELARARRSESDDDEHDPEGVPLSTEWSRLSGRLDAARAELSGVEESERRLAAGEYGVCTACGRAIPIARLRARPAARTCVPCGERLAR
ncbi:MULTISPECIES: TraR/DksA family transcriptional regulator [unclassified Leucobacter]|uniref:TraR/DksA family transcriptional regulator n=1 Tax=unclassified Leucobacter TaxID=2621730 RepID=UPI00062119B2|nr:TraR/DksA C4-type zinc finger protein [Leucobacter sp. Ag1]KKI20158.1 molecular chaperone DnaK [Leucobacter sp. Ag1]